MTTAAVVVERPARVASATCRRSTASTSTGAAARRSAYSATTAPARRPSIRVLTTLHPARPRAGARRRHRRRRRSRPVRRRIGVTGQYAGLDDYLTATENLELVGRLAGLRTAAGAEPATSIERLRPRRHRRPPRRRTVGRITTTRRPRRQPRRLTLGAVPRRADHRPRPDRPRRPCGTWSPSSPPTARPSCSPPNTSTRPTGWPTSIVVLDHGRVAARGTPAELKRAGRRQGRHRDHPRRSCSTRCPTVPTRTRPAARPRRRRRTAPADAAAAAEVVGRLADEGVDVSDLEVASPSLDDVFAHLTSTRSPA